MNYENKKVAVIGFGIEGQDAVKYLINKSAQVTVFDVRDRIEMQNFKGIKFITGERYLEKGLLNFDLIVRSPGVYRFTKEIVEAEKSGSKVTSAIKIFFDECPCKIIGVTGTKGKGTTATLIYKILKSKNTDVHLAGNIGKPFLELLPRLNKDSLVVLELSSFQLIDLHKSPHVAVVLNITTDHLDWHKDRDEYLTSKMSIAKFQTKNDFCVINSDYKDSKSFEKLGEGQKLYISTKKKTNGCYVYKDSFWLNLDKVIEIGNTSKLTLRGKHNWENICAAVCVTSLLGADVQSIRNTVFSFKGYEHRLEFVRDNKGIKFYNDSAGTGPDTAIAAINSFFEPLTLIIGGFEKKLDYSKMAKVISKKKNVQNIIFIGDIGPRLEKEVELAGFNGNIFQMGKVSMEKIVNKATQVTMNGGSVLLEPATSSFDMFDSYKDRGDQFKDAVLKLH